LPDSCFRSTKKSKAPAIISRKSEKRCFMEFGIARGRKSSISSLYPQAYAFSFVRTTCLMKAF
jgi:hypothetical protein